MSTIDQFVAFGDERYKVRRPFASWPAGLKIGVFSKGTTDSKGNLYVCQRADPPILVFDRDGKFDRSMGNGREMDSHGIWITPDDRLFVVDRDSHQLICFSPQGKQLFAIGEPNRPRFNAPFSHPTDIVVVPGGDIYVAD